MRGLGRILAVMAASCGVITGSGFARGEVLRVDWESASVAPDGQSWEEAYWTLDAAIAAATRGADEIWVRGSDDLGNPAVYYPGSDPAASFIIDGLRVYGGFAGDEDYEYERDPANYETILRGDLWQCCSAPDAVEHVVQVTPDATLYDPADTVLSGFIIEDGYAGSFSSTLFDDRGGGILIDSASPTIDRCIVRGNLADDRGGGMYIHNGSPTITYCTFESNTAPEGGGVFALIGVTGSLSGPIGAHFDHSDFVGNVATGGGDSGHAGGGGGGLKLQTNVAPGDEGYDDTELTHCNFIANRLSYIWDNYCQTTAGGAGLFIQGGPRLEDCDFIENGPWNADCNEMQINGGGVAINNFVVVDHEGESYLHFTAEFQDCVFRHNGHVTGVTTCDLPDDDPDLGEVAQVDFINHGGGVYIQRSVDLELDPPLFPNPLTTLPHHDAEFQDCLFIGNVSGNGGGVFMDRAAATFDGCCWMDNDADGRAAHVLYDNDHDSTPCEEEEFEYVQIAAAYGGGAISTYRLSHFTLTDCKLAHNTASLWSGGAVYVYQGSAMEADRCYFVGNRAPSGTDSTPPYTNLGPGTGGAIWVNTECLDGQGGCADSGITTEHAVANVYNSLIVGNYAEGKGGAVFTERAGWSTLVNCIVMFNHAAETGGVLSDSTQHTDFNGELCLNHVFNSIVWGNTDSAYADQREEVHDNFLWDTDHYEDDEIRVGYSCVDSLGGGLAVSVYPISTGTIGDSGADYPGVPIAIEWGDWTTSAVYYPETGQTKFTKSGAGWTTNASRTSL